MSRKHAELEREFIDDLPTRTGRSLDEWMIAIKTAGLSEKNAIIDWLRPQGLTFAHASWLERIHNNGGRPIYLGLATPEPAKPAVPGVPTPPTAPKPASKPIVETQAKLMPVVSPATALPQAPLGSGPGDVSPLLLRAKGLRPLAEMVVREIIAAVPGASASASGELIAVSKPREFAVLLNGPKELRLGLHGGDATPDLKLVPARIPGTGAHITHMLILNDARQVGPALLEAVRRADREANGG